MPATTSGRSYIWRTSSADRDGNTSAFRPEVQPRTTRIRNTRRRRLTRAGCAKRRPRPDVVAMRPLGTSVAILLLGSAIHADWHFARPAHHRLSLDLSWHWLLAIPVFALAAYYVASRKPANPLATS